MYLFERVLQRKDRELSHHWFIPRMATRAHAEASRSLRGHSRLLSQAGEQEAGAEVGSQDRYWHLYRMPALQRGSFTCSATIPAPTFLGFF